MRTAIAIAGLTLAMFMGAGCRGGQSVGQEGLDLPSENVLTFIDEHRAEEVGGVTIVIPDQAPNDFVTVAAVETTVNGFVVIKRGNPESSLILGSTSLITAGPHGTIVALLMNEPTKDGETLYGVFYVDEGDGGFQEDLDTMMVDGNGEPVFTSFTVRKGATPGSEIRI